MACYAEELRFKDEEKRHQNQNKETVPQEV